MQVSAGVDGGDVERFRHGDAERGRGAGCGAGSDSFGEQAFNDDVATGAGEAEPARVGELKSVAHRRRVAEWNGERRIRAGVAEMGRACDADRSGISLPVQGRYSLV
ncbi:hypothetical protein D3C72_755130 [compost metagenome]